MVNVKIFQHHHRQLGHHLHQLVDLDKGWDLMVNVKIFLQQLKNHTVHLDSGKDQMLNVLIFLKFVHLVRNWGLSEIARGIVIGMRTVLK